LEAGRFHKLNAIFIPFINSIPYVGNAKELELRKVKRRTKRKFTCLIVKKEDKAQIHLLDCDYPLPRGGGRGGTWLAILSLGIDLVQGGEVGGQPLIHHFLGCIERGGLQHNGLGGYIRHFAVQEDCGNVLRSPAASANLYKVADCSVGCFTPGFNMLRGECGGPLLTVLLAASLPD
jgi:hypothetical protein